MTTEVLRAQGVFQPPLLDEFIRVELNGIGKDTIDDWSFLRVIGAELFSTEAVDTSPLVKTTLIHTYEDNEIKSTSITLSTRTKYRDLDIGCNRLIDTAINVLNAGEDLRIVIREAKEAFIEDQRKMRERLENLKVNFSETISNSRHTIPDGFIENDRHVVFREPNSQGGF